MTAGVYLARRAGFSHGDCKRLLDRLHAVVEQPLVAGPRARDELASDPLFAAIRQVSPRLGSQLLRMVGEPHALDARAEAAALGAVRRYAERAWQRATPFAGLAGIATQPGAAAEDARALLFESGARRVDRVFATSDGFGADTWLVSNAAVIRRGPDLLVPELVLQEQPSPPRSSRTRATRPIDAILEACRVPRRAGDVLEDSAALLQVPVDRLRSVVAHLIDAQLLFAQHERVALTELVAPTPFRVTGRREALTHDVADAQVVLDALPVEFPAPDVERRVERVLRKVAGRATVRRDEAADAYAMAFLDRFGIGVRVPLLRVVDRAFGVGFVDEGPATTATASTPVDIEKRRILESVVRRAATEGTRSVELDRADLDRLLQRERRPFREFDAMYEIDGQDGDTAWVTRIGRTALAGATAGRFHRAVPEGVFLGAADEQDANGAAVKPATVWFLPRWSTSLDVMDMPSPVPLRIEVDFRSGDDSARGLDDLDVAHDGERLILLDRRDDRPIVVRNHSMFNVGQLASPLVRTLLTLSRETLSEWLVFDWGPLDGWDFLPGIVHDGVGLSRPLWRLPSAVLDRARPDSEREAAFLRWKADRGVSGHLEFGDGDQTLTTDVDDPDAWSLIAAVLTPDSPLAFGAVARSESDPAVEYVQRIRPGGEAHRSMRQTSRLRPLALTDTGADLEWVSLELALGVGLPEPRHWSALLGVAAEHDVTDWHHLYFNDPDHHLRLRFRSPDPARRAALRAALEDAAFRMARDTFRRVSSTPYFPEWERYGGRANAELIWRLFTESSEAVVASSTAGGRDLGGADHLARVVAVAVGQVQALVGSDWREHIDHGLAHVRADRRSHHRRAEALRILRGRVPDAPTAAGDYRDGPGLAPVRGVINSVLHMHSNRAFPGDRDEEIVLLSTLRSLARLPAVGA